MKQTGAYNQVDAIQKGRFRLEEGLELVIRPKLIAPTWAVLLLLVAGQQEYGVPQQTDPTAAITAQIVKARDYTSEYVVIAKQSLTKAPSDLQQAQKLYALAYANYDAWVAYVSTALRDGKAKRLNKDAEYQKISSDAATAGTAFIAFVDSKTGEPKAVTVLLSSLGALGLQLWNGIKDREEKDRAAAATDFGQTAKWSPWEAITQDSLAKPQPTEPAKPSAPTKPSQQSSPPKSSKSPNA